MNGQRVIVSDICWSPDGNAIAALLAYWQSDKFQSKIVLIELEN